jgi:cobalt/nickel transport system permease protein
MKANVKLFIAAGLVVGLALALLVSPFASSSPDGLEKVASEEGFEGSAREHDTADSPLADYGVDGVDDERVGTGLAGVIGVLLTFGIGLGLFAAVRALRPADRTPAASTGPPR